MQTKNQSKQNFYKKSLVNKKLARISLLLSASMGIIFVLSWFAPEVWINRFYMTGFIATFLSILSGIYYFTTINIERKKVRLINKIAKIELKIAPLEELWKSGNWYIGDRRIKKMNSHLEEKQELKFELELIG